MDKAEKLEISTTNPQLYAEMMKEGVKTPEELFERFRYYEWLALNYPTPFLGCHDE